MAPTAFAWTLLFRWAQPSPRAIWWASKYSRTYVKTEYKRSSWPKLSSRSTRIWRRIASSRLTPRSKNVSSDYSATLTLSYTHSISSASITHRLSTSMVNIGSLRRLSSIISCLLSDGLTTDRRGANGARFSLTRIRLRTHTANRSRAYTRLMNYYSTITTSISFVLHPPISPLLSANNRLG